MIARTRVSWALTVAAARMPVRFSPRWSEKLTSRKICFVSDMITYYTLRRSPKDPCLATFLWHIAKGTEIEPRPRPLATYQTNVAKTRGFRWPPQSVQLKFLHKINMWIQLHSQIVSNHQELIIMPKVNLPLRLTTLPLSSLGCYCGHCGSLLYLCPPIPRERERERVTCGRVSKTWLGQARKARF